MDAVDRPKALDQVGRERLLHFPDAHVGAAVGDAVGGRRDARVGLAPKGLGEPPRPGQVLPPGLAVLDLQGRRAAKLDLGVGVPTQALDAQQSAVLGIC